MALQSGDKVGPYEIVSEIGRGGMATVYRAYEASMDRHVAVKVLPEQFLHDPNFLARFTQEARIIARLEHPRILPVHQFGEAGGVPYIAMRLMPHGSVRDRLRAGPLSLAEVARIIGQVAEALDFAHARGVIHRDLKPDNVLLDEAGNACLSDFGIAKVIQASLSTSGTLVGTPAYMSPEQIRGRTPSPQSDVYALGAMTFELLAGRPPFEAEDAPALMYLHVHQPVPRLAELRRGLPKDLQAIIEKAMAKKPEGRYQSVGEFAGALSTVAGKAAREEKRVPVSPLRRPEPVLSPTLEPVSTPPAVTPRPLGTRLSAVRARPRLMLGALALGGGALLLAGVLVLAGILWAGARLFNGGVGPTLAPAPSEISGTAASGPTLPPASTLVTAASTATPTLTLTLTPAASATTISRVDNAALVFVPAGEFAMGSENGNFDERPVHAVYLDDFWMDRTEVTNAMYAMCVEAGACQPPNSTSSNSRSQYYGDPQYDDFPVFYVSWNDANDYCRWAGRRLPTEAEWEKAARGTDGRQYPWGNASPGASLLNYNVQVGDTTEVGAYPEGASPYGALDMAGNAWEWVADWYDGNYYSASPAQNPAGPSSGSYRVLRGGSWNVESADVRAANRGRNYPGIRYFYVGFRCSRSR